MSIESELNEKIEQLEDIFKKEMSELNKQIIMGSPVDKGKFKTSWQLLEFEPSKLSFHMHNPTVYGLGLWRYGKSKQGWSPTGGDELVLKAERRMNEAIRAIK